MKRLKLGFTVTSRPSRCTEYSILHSIVGGYNVPFFGFLVVAFHPIQV